VLDRISNLDRPPLITAKIEKPQAVERIEPILAAVDAVMVARGDLGVEMPPEKVPVIQKRIIAAARRSGRPVITATQMLRSMVDSPRPLRAEASDIANAVFDGTDALMLSEETAIGRYPEQAVRMLDRVAREVEPELGHDRLNAASDADGTPDLTDAVSLAACELAAAIGAAAIVTTTSSGGTARMIARHRPSMPVLGVTSSMTVARQLNLSWGVVPVAVASTDDPIELRRMLLRELTDHQLAKPGDHVVIVAGLPLGFSDAANVIQVHRLD
jgi:pyruvate kinase